MLGTSYPCGVVVPMLGTVIGGYACMEPTPMLGTSYGRGEVVPLLGAVAAG